MNKKTVYMVEVGYGMEWLPMVEFSDLEVAKYEAEEYAISEDTQTRIKVYEIEYSDKLANLLTRTREILSKQLIEIL